MSSRYRCKDCGLVWRDIAVKEGESNPFLRCLRCESRNIDFPKTVKLKTKLIIWLIISVIIGIIGAGIGIWIHSSYNWGDPWTIGLTGFLIGFFAPSIIFLILDSHDLL